MSGKLSPEEIREQLEKHAPYVRVTTGEVMAVDRQWLALLGEVFRETDITQLMRAGLPQYVCTELLGLTAIEDRDY